MRPFPRAVGVIVKAMTRIAPWLIAAVLSLTPLSAAQALCVYRGALDARTTLSQEYADADQVVRARVVSALDGGGEADGEYWTLYQLETLTTFKGRMPDRFSLFTERNSGGFYMDRDGGGADVSGEYLLFLKPSEPGVGRPAAAREAFVVNYSCGQSRRWAEVGTADAMMLEALAARTAAAR